MNSNRSLKSGNDIFVFGMQEYAADEAAMVRSIDLQGLRAVWAEHRTLETRNCR